MNSRNLFEPAQLRGRLLANRIVMAPMARGRALADGTPTPMMATYYAQRAEAALIVSEGVVVSPQGVSYPRVPGLYADRHVDAWRAVTDAVHDRGGVIYAQLWHVGRQSHSSVQPDGLPPWAPSAVAITGYEYYRKPDRLPYETPRELTRQGIRAVVADFASAAARAALAGFDGVEIHGANGYLIDQFLNSGSNLRADEYGGSPSGRVRFLHELLEAVGSKLPLSSVGVRLSPSSSWMDAHDDDKMALHSHVVRSLNRYDLAYLHIVEPGIAGSISVDDSDGDIVPTAMLRSLYDGPVVVTGGHTLASAHRALGDGVADFVGFGRAFIANPDLPVRLRDGLPIASADPKTFYSGGVDGYLTYPAWADRAPMHATT